MDADAPQLLAVDPQLHVADGLGVGPGADGVLVVVEDPHLSGEGFIDGVGEGLDRAATLTSDRARSSPSALMTAWSVVRSAPARRSGWWRTTPARTAWSP